MVGGTLRDIRAAIGSLTCPDGNYAVVCGRTGDEPSPLTNRRFPDRHSAGEAAELAVEYRAALRRYDPAVPYFDPVVQEVPRGTITPSSPRSGDRRTRFISFCHDVTGAVYEALSETGQRDVESAAMETYLTLAEVVDDGDDFCLTMLWSVMSEMDVRLSASEKRAVVGTAADLFGAAPSDDPVGATLRTLENAGFIEGYSLRSVGSSSVESTRAWEFTVGNYALAERTGRLPTLPIAVDVLRRLPGGSVRFADGRALSEARWRLTVETSPASAGDGLVSVDATENRWLNDTHAPSTDRLR